MFNLNDSLNKREELLLKSEKESKKKYFGKLKLLGISSYKEYLSSNYWKQIKDKMYSSKIPKKCYCCGSSKQLNVHHKKYKLRDIDSKILTNFIFLCNDCHREVHNLQKDNKYLTINQATKKYRSIKNYKIKIN